MILRFKDTGGGFILESSDFGNYEKSQLGYDYSGEIGDNVLSNQNGEIVLYSLVFKNGLSSLDISIQEAKDAEIPGVYTATELNLENVSFKEVLKSVKDYYSRKLSIPTGRRARA